MERKRCVYCEQELPLSEFYREPRHKDGLASRCKKCHRIKDKIPIQKKQDKLREKGLKKCNKCGEEKPLGEFHKNNRSIDGHTSLCKTCACAKAREHRHKQNHSPITQGVKYCRVCGEEKDVSCFNRNRRRKDGLDHTCRQCQKEYKKKYNEENRELISKRRKIYHQTQAYKDRVKAYREKNRERIAYLSRMRKNKQSYVEKRTSRNKYHRENLTDIYIKQLLWSRHIPITQENINAKRESITKKRNVRYYIQNTDKRICASCGELKPKSEFGVAYCKPCESKKSADWIKRHPEYNRLKASQRSKRLMETYHPIYLRSLLLSQGFSDMDMTPDLIAEKREQLKLERAYRLLNKEIKNQQNKE